MTTPTHSSLICDTPNPSVRVVRFIRPDLRPQLYDQEAIADCTLYREFAAAALVGLGSGQTVVINFGIVDWFPTAFYRVMLVLREAIHAQNARMLLCCLTPSVRECFDLMGGGKIFEIRATEASAIAAAGK
jgi:anti-anti-sigma regulatory factor